MARLTEVDDWLLGCHKDEVAGRFQIDKTGRMSSWQESSVPCT